MPRESTICGRCRQPITAGSIITLAGVSYHDKCFGCSACSALLAAAEGGVHTKEGRPYCARCWVDRFAERCGVCDNPFLPKQRVVVFNAKRMHPTCFVCAGRCGTCLGNERGSKFLQQDGLPYCHACYTAKFVPKCGICSQPIEGGTRYVIHKGAKIHPSCFCCVECGQVLGGGQTPHYERDGMPYCAEDYAKRFGETCALCSTKLLSWITVPTGESYCRSHEGVAPPCHACGRLVDPALAGGRGGIDLADGRVSCRQCAATAISSLEHAKPLLRDVRAFLVSLGLRGLPEASQINLVLLQRSELLSRNGFQKSSHRHQTCPLGLTCAMETTTYTTHPGGAGGRTTTTATPTTTTSTSRHIDAVCVLVGLPKELCASTLAHELGHVYLHMSNYNVSSMAAPLAEGVCELLAYLWLTRGSRAEGDAQLVVRVRAMMENTDKVYGQGFRDALAAYYECGSSLPNLLAEIRRLGRLPTAGARAQVLPTSGSPSRVARQLHQSAASAGADGSGGGGGGGGGGGAARVAAGMLAGAPVPPSKPSPSSRSPLVANIPPHQPPPPPGGAAFAGFGHAVRGGRTLRPRNQ